MTAVDPTFNLTALSERFFAEKRHLALAGQIRRARDQHSLCTDLVMAKESVDALREELKSPASSDDHRKLITESALLNNAVVLYDRATKTASDERGGFDLRSRFNEAENVVHKELSDLRDKAIARFGSGGAYQGEWQAELVILQLKGTDGKPGVVTRRQTIDRALLERARQQIDVALALLRGIYMSTLKGITDELNSAIETNPDFYQEIGRHPLNFELFMKSAEAAAAAIAAYDIGYGKGGFNHR